MELVSTEFFILYLLSFHLYCIYILYSVLNCFVNCITPQRSCLVGDYCFLLVDYVLNAYCGWISLYGICGSCFYKLYFSWQGFSPVFKRNSAEFSINSRELGYFRNLSLNSLGVGILVSFKRVVIS